MSQIWFFRPVKSDSLRATNGCYEYDISERSGFNVEGTHRCDYWASTTGRNLNTCRLLTLSAGTAAQNHVVQVLFYRTSFFYHFFFFFVNVCVCACMHACVCVCACVRACMRAFVCVPTCNACNACHSSTRSLVTKPYTICSEGLNWDSILSQMHLLKSNIPGSYA